MKQHQVEIDTSKCIGCGMCTRVCPAHSIEIKDKKSSNPVGRLPDVRAMHRSLPYEGRFNQRLRYRTN